MLLNTCIYARSSIALHVCDRVWAYVGRRCRVAILGLIWSDGVWLRRRHDPNKLLFRDKRSHKRAQATGHRGADAGAASTTNIIYLLSNKCHFVTIKRTLLHRFFTITSQVFNLRCKWNIIIWHSSLRDLRKSINILINILFIMWAIATVIDTRPPTIYDTIYASKPSCVGLEGLLGQQKLNLH